MIFYGKFPALNQLVVFELLVQEYFQWRVKCSVELSLTDMYWTIEGECEFLKKFDAYYLQVNRHRRLQSINNFFIKLTTRCRYLLASVLSDFKG